MDEAVKLGVAIAEAAKRAGIYNGEGALDGPTLLLLLNDMEGEIKRLREYEWMYKDLCK